MTREFIYGSTVLKRLNCVNSQKYISESKSSAASFNLLVFSPCLLPYGEPVVVTAAVAAGIRAHLPHLAHISGLEFHLLLSVPFLFD